MAITKIARITVYIYFYAMKINLLRWLPLLLLLHQCGGKKDEGLPGAPLFPINAQPVDATVSDVYGWAENDLFFVVGICNNRAAQWQKIWLQVELLDAGAQPLLLSGQPTTMITPFSDAIPPMGRSSFFAYWPLKEIKGTPVNCRVKPVGAVQQSPGPILVVQGFSGLRMMAPEAEGQPATIEIGWQGAGALSNPLQQSVTEPRFEVLLYGQDGRLWLSSLMRPGDPGLNWDAKPLLPGESRPFGFQVGYQSLPKGLQTAKIGRVEVLPFAGRQVGR